MELFIKIGKKFIVFGIMLIAMNFVYEYFFFEKDLKDYSEIIFRLREVAKDNEILYFGESSNLSTHPKDVNKKRISELIAEYFPDLKMTDVTKPAEHAEMYYHLLTNIPDDSPVKTVIVTMNLRSFNAQWIFSDLETPIQKELVLIKKRPPLFSRFILSFKAYEIKTDAERNKQVKRMWKRDEFDLPFKFKYKNVIEWDGDVWKGGIIVHEDAKSADNAVLATHYVKAYAFQIKEDNPRIRDFDRIVELAKERDWNLVFNLLAENVDKANWLLGDTILYFMRENRDFLIERYGKDATVVDNLTVVRDMEFTDQKWTTEHYTESGRKRIARNVALSLKEFYPDKFVEVKYAEEKISSEFYFDCETAGNAGYMKTIVDYMPSFGKYCSVVNKDTLYSIGLQKKLNEISYLDKDSVFVDMKFLQTKKENDSKLVVQLVGQNGNNVFWKGYPISERVSKINQWIDYKFSLKIPEEISNASEIKIYVINESENNVFVDNMKISFR